MKIRYRIVFLLVVLSAAMQTSVYAETDSSAQADMVMFVEEEPGIEAYPTRMLVTKDFLRLDDGADEGDFILFDRQARTISSVSHGNRSILRIYPHPVEIDTPIALEHKEISNLDSEAPKIGGKAPLHVSYSTNDETCVQVMAVPDLLEGVRLAMIEYRDVLAGEQALNLYKTPTEMQSPCMLSELVFAPSRHLQHGFPVQQWDPSGYSRALVDFKEGVTVGGGLFEIPLEYSVYSVNPAD